MWAHLIKLASLSKGALVVGVAASAAMVSTAEFSNAPSHQEQPSMTASATASASAKTNVTVTAPKATEKPAPQSTTTTTTPSSASPKTEEKHGEIPQVVKDCVDRYLAIRARGDSAPDANRQAIAEVCTPALAATGLTSAEFAAKFGLDAKSGTSAPTTVKGDLSPEALAMARECVTKYNAKSTDASTTCKRAIELSGLTSADFAAKFLQRPAATPTPKSTVNTETYALVARCLQLYAGATTSGDPKAVSDACAAAIKASGLSSTDFWAKYGKELATTKPSTQPAPTASPKPATNTAELSQLVAKCLQLYAAVSSTSDTKSVSEACGAAIRASGMTPAEFWAKFHPTTN
jgi:hypothetical protein